MSHDCGALRQEYDQAVIRFDEATDTSRSIVGKRTSDAWKKASEAERAGWRRDFGEATKAEKDAWLAMDLAREAYAQCLSEGGAK